MCLKLFIYIYAKHLYTYVYIYVYTYIHMQWHKTGGTFVLAIANYNGDILV